jgi:hypothetical protein
MKTVTASLMLLSALASCGVSAQRAQDQAKNAAREQSPSPSQGPARQPAAPADPNKFAIIITGAGGEEQYTKTFTDQAQRLFESLTGRLGFAEKQVFLLTEGGTTGPEDTGEPPPQPARRATAAEVRKAFEAVKSAAGPESLVLIVLIGHGSFDNQQAKLSLVGPDLTSRDYAGLVSALPARRVVFVNCASSSGEFIKPLSAEGRIVVTSTRSGNEQNLTVFADHFIAGLTDDAADADKNGRISVLEAFNYATKLSADWYKEKNRLATEHALIDDNGDGAGHETATAGDGALARSTYLDSKALAEAGTDADLARLITRRRQLEEEIEKLKLRKSEMKSEDYEAELERLLVDLAKVNQEIKLRK